MKTAKEKKRDYERKRRQAIQRWYIEYKDSCSCCVCGETSNVCLEFHHIDPETKEHNVFKLAWKGYSIKKIKAEIDKCVCVCANCHRKIHTGEIKLV